MTDSAPKGTSQPPTRPDPDLAPNRRSRKNGALLAALWGAALAICVNAATTVWSNYLTRRDQHFRSPTNATDWQRA